jgi:hypothetical protein
MLMVWKDRPVNKVGDLVDALYALKDESDGAAFMAAYEKFETAEVARSNVGYCAGYLSSADAQRAYQFTGTHHPIFGVAS